MPKINRSNTTYCKLPEELKTGSLSDAKCSMSVTLTLPKELQDRANKFIKEAHEMVEDAFKKFVKKEIKRYEKDES